MLLIDEADVFLAKRTQSDIKRNAFVSIFLRSLEYYQGIMILTTNRKHDFDDAFASRIHITIRFDDPNPEQRTLIWRNLFEEFQPELVLGEDMATKLGSYQLNGREIKNLFSTAMAMVSRSGEKMSLDQIDEIYELNKVSQDDEEVLTKTTRS